MRQAPASPALAGSEELEPHRAWRLDLAGSKLPTVRTTESPAPVKRSASYQTVSLTLRWQAAGTRSVQHVYALD